MKDVQKWIRIQATVTLIMFLGVAALAGYTLYEAAQNRAAFCKFRRDLESRVEFAQNILDTHQGQPVIFGIPRPVYVSSIKNQQRSIDSLSNLDC